LGFRVNDIEFKVCILTGEDLGVRDCRLGSRAAGFMS
jgi:hypothetical protein